MICRATLWVLAILALAGLAQAKPPTGCTPITESRVRSLFDRWNAALATGNPDTVTQLYATQATLLPTVENGPLVGRTAIRGYFVTFLKKHPHGTIDRSIVRIGCNTAIDVGLYTFALDGSTAGQRVQVPARFTFIYRLEGGRWLIEHHHSSVQPQPPP